MIAFSLQMSYYELADALHHVALSSGILSPCEWECVQSSVRRPVTQKLLALHPLPKSLQKVITNTIEEIRARHPDQALNPALINVHSIIYSGERAKTAAYLKKTYSPVQRPDLMERFCSLIHEAVFYNEDVQRILLQGELQRFRERERDYQEKLKSNPSRKIHPPSPSTSIEIIRSDFADYLKHLENSKKGGSTYGWAILECLIQHYESRSTLEEQLDALLSLVSALDEARTAYHAHDREYVTGKKYTCQAGFEERLLDHHHHLRPLTISAPQTPLEQIVFTLTEPFINRVAEVDGCRVTFSNALYNMYCEIAGYRIVIPEPYDIYRLKEQIKHNDQELEAQYLASLQKKFSPMSERLKTHYHNQFQSQLGSLRQNAVSACSHMTPELKFLLENHFLETVSYQPSTSLQRIFPEKSEEEIFNAMLERYPCFLGAAHLKLILTLHNLYGSFDSYATFSTLKKVAESGFEVDINETIDVQTIQEAYSGYPASRAFVYYDFYPCNMDELNALTSELTQYVHIWPCSQDVLVQWLTTHRSMIFADQAKKLAAHASKTGYVNALKILLNAPYSVSPNHICSQAGVSLLSLAIQQGYSHVVDFLLRQKNIDVNQCDRHRNTALIYALEFNHINILRKLIAAGADVKGRNRSKVPLIEASKNPNIRLLRELLRAGASVNDTDEDGATALLYAVQNDYAHIVRDLIEAGANLSYHYRGFTAFAHASEWGKKEIARDLIAAGVQSVTPSDALGKVIYFFDWWGEPSPSIKDLHLHITRLKMAIFEDDTQEVSQLIGEKPFLGNAYIREIDSSALMLALQQGRINIVEQFMCGKMIPCHVQEALIYAIEHPNVHNAVSFLAEDYIVELMVRQKYPIIALASRHRCLGAVRIFLEAGARVNQADEHGYTGLMYAVRPEKECIELFELLIAHGASIEIIANGGRNPVREYLSKKSQIEERSSHSQKPLLFTPPQPQEISTPHTAHFDSHAHLEL